MVYADGVKGSIVNDETNGYGFATWSEIPATYAVETTLAQIRLAWQRLEDATTVGEIQAALAEVSRLVHRDA